MPRMILLTPVLTRFPTRPQLLTRRSPFPVGRDHLSGHACAFHTDHSLKERRT
jgi:hypothetical protein